MGSPRTASAYDFSVWFIPIALMMMTRLLKTMSLGGRGQAPGSGSGGGPFERGGAEGPLGGSSVTGFYKSGLCPVFAHFRPSF